MALNLDTVGEPIGPLVKEYDWKDVVLYALGVGAGFDDLEYVYEQKLKVIPSFSIGAVFDFLAASALSSQANLAGILHGEQDILFHAPIPTEGTLTTSGAITHIFDKGEGKGALVISEADTVHDNGRRLFTNKFTLFCRRDGGFGGDDAPPEVFAFPDRAPDFTEDATPSKDQPLVYRLSGDIFALHVDPDFARASGFEMPIMHGLCTFGFACRHVVKHLMPGEPERMSRYKVRFSKTLYPGTPIQTQIWKTGEGRAVFRVINQATGDVVIDRGIVEWLDDEGMRRREMMQGIRYVDDDGEPRVAIVTGAGAGLGKAYALELARRGARVVVNDLGGARDGSGEGSAMAADEVVREIVEAGGEAVASYDSVSSEEGGRAIVARAVDTWGRVDILINNAGILRDKSLVKMEPSAWEPVLAVHLDAGYYVTRPAFLKMKQQGYGRIVLTTSAAGLFGNFGQTNYSAAKLGLVGLMNTLEIEGRKYDIKVNTVAPLATTRLSEDIIPPEFKEALKPECVAPMTLYLASQECPVSGQIYNAGAGHFSRVEMVTGPGEVPGDGKAVPTPEQVAAVMENIADLDDREIYVDANAAIMGMMTRAQQGPGGAPKKKAAPAADAGGGGGGGISPAEVFARMPEQFVADAAAGLDLVFQFRLDGDGGGAWYATIADQACTVSEGEHDSPTTTILMGAADFVGMIEGKLDAMNLYTTGKLKIEGDLMKSQLIEKLFEF